LLGSDKVVQNSMKQCILSSGYRRIFPRGGNLPRRKADHSLLYSAEVKNDGAVPSLTYTSSWRGA
jgi:hypothetical protein